MKNYLLKIALLAIVLSPLMPTESSEKNHKTLRYNRAQSHERFVTVQNLRSPMPWEKR